MHGLRRHTLGLLVSATAAAVTALGAQEPVATGIRMIAMYDPVADVRTFEALEPLTGREILALQTALARVGFDPGPLDGQRGPGTRGALGRFQRERELRVCGCVSYETVMALGLRPLVVQTVIGPSPEAHEIEVILPKGLPPVLQARPTAPAALDAPGQGAQPAQVQPPSYLDSGWWVPVFPLHPPFLEPLRGSGRRGQAKGRGRGGAGDRGGILIGPGPGGQGVRGGGVRTVPALPRGTPRPNPPSRPRPNPPPPSRPRK